MSKIIPEILAPAGSPQQLVAAVRAGADAVYMGAGSMNARAGAANFDNSQLADAVAYCHQCGVKVYLTMNTLLFDDEFEKAMELLALVCSLGIDGIIVQDMGLARCIAAFAPDVRLHASTQMSIHNPAALSAIAKLGFCRAVLAREMSERELRDAAEGSPVELEVFVHGALCMSVSGQCLLSAMLGSRSGNRGRCAQPCRLPFRAGDAGYCLSLKDNSLLPHIQRLWEMGICSLKIEGRMKRPEYCAAAVTACRQARDGEGVSSDMGERLEAVFSRSGFTDGYFSGRRGRGMFGYRTKDDVTAADSSTMAALHELYKNEFRRVSVNMAFSAKMGEAMSLTVSDEDGNSCCVEGSVPLIAENRPTTESSVAERLAKTGGTPYLAGDIRCSVEDGLMLPASALNAMRRDALEKLSEMRRRFRSIPFHRQDEDIVPFETEGEPQLHAVLASMDQLPANIPKEVRRIYLPLESGRDALESAVKNLGAAGIEIAVEASRGIFGQEEKIRIMMKDAASVGIRVCMVHNIGLIEPALTAGLESYGGFGLNITNSRAIKAYEELSLCGAELSYELTLDRISRLGGTMPRGICIYGRQALMLTRNCPARLGGRCPEGGGCQITDRMGVTFPVRCRMGCSEVYNSIPLSIVDKKSQIASVSHLLMRFSVENSVETEEKMMQIAKNYPLGNREYTRGLYYRGVM